MNGENFIPLEDGTRRERSSREHHGSRREREDRRERERERGGDRDRDRERDRDRDRERDRDRDRDRDRRRRSRSPYRPRHDEPDTYSSSRDYREREREHRYRDRGDDRWERGDRSSRRERREDDDRPPRRDRDRDLFDDARRRGGISRRDREERKRSSSPAARKVKEPTPDLTHVVSVLVRKRRLTQWDIKPPNYENITAEQAKMSGMFPLPGAPRQQPMDLSRLQAMVNQPGSQASASALKPSHARQSKRLFVYNIPPGNTQDSLVEFFNLHLNGLNVIKGQDPCVSCLLSQDTKVALLEFKQPEEATVALALDGITMTDDDNMETSNGYSNGESKGLHITRPKDYIAPTPDPDQDQAEGLSENVPDSPNKIMVTHIPTHASDESVIELLSAFGPLKSFVLVKDVDTETSRGIAFCEYEDPAQTTNACENLNGMDLGGTPLVVKRASVGLQQAAGLEMGINAMSMIAGTTSADLQKGRVIQLLNMVTPEELVDNDEYAEIIDDVREECSKFGNVLDIKIPRPAGARQNPGVGKIFVKYETVEQAEAALSALAGRQFSHRTVVVTFFGEDYFDVEAW